MAKATSCQYCARELTNHSGRQLFCSVVCRVRYHRETECTCFFCGYLAPKKNQMIVQFTKGWGSGYINCCPECNSLLGENYPSDLYERTMLLCGIFAKKYGLDRSPLEWTEEEVVEVCKTSFRSFQTWISPGHRQRVVNEQRVSHIRLRSIWVKDDKHINSIEGIHQINKRIELLEGFSSRSLAEKLGVSQKLVRSILRENKIPKPYVWKGEDYENIAKIVTKSLIRHQSKKPRLSRRFGLNSLSEKFAITSNLVRSILKENKIPKPYVWNEENYEKITQIVTEGLKSKE
jgi:hypothetical protein